MLISSIPRRSLPAALAVILIFGLVRVGFPQASQSCSANPAGATTACAAAGPASQDSGAGVDTGAGNPINVTNGNKYQRETDLAALPGELGVEIVRHYNSSASRVVGLLGNGWRLSYETDLYVLGRSIQILQADGARLVFSRDRRGLCSSHNPAQGRVIVRSTARGEEFTWEWPNGRKLDFNPQGRLEQIRSPSGAFLTLTRAPGGELLRVTDPQRRELRFHYPDRGSAGKNPGRFRGIVAIDTPAGRFKYEHSGDLTGAGPSPGNLIKVDIPTHYDSRTRLHAYTERGITGSSVSRLYHYENPDFPMHLTGITVGGAGSDQQRVNQRIATYRYDKAGRAVLSARGEPARPGADGRPVSGTGIEEVRLQFPRPGVTRLTNSLGQATTYRHAIIAGEYRLLEARGAGCARCGEVNVRYVYDRLGRIQAATRLDSKGRPIAQTKTERDLHGRIVRVSRIVHGEAGAGHANGWVRYEYPAPGGDALPGDRPTLIAGPSVVPGREHSLRIDYNSAGQPLEVRESGWALATGGTPAGPIERSRSFRYSVINGRSLLTQLGGLRAKRPGPGSADADTTRIEWDGLGAFVIAVTTPGGIRSAVSHDEAGRIARLAEASGHATSFTYDARNQLIEREQDGVRYRYLYDAFGNPVEGGYDAGSGYRALAHFAYDGAGRPLWRASHLGILDSRRLDSESRLLEARSQSASHALSERYAYDDLGRLTAVSTGAGEGEERRIAYDAQGRPETITDALGRATRYRYAANGGISQIVAAAGSMGGVEARLMNTTVRFEHDALHRINALIAANGAVTRIIRDDFGRILSVSSPDSGTERNGFDAADRLVSAMDARGNRARYEYDAAGRIVKQEILAAGGGPASAAPPLVTTWRYQGAQLAAIDHPGQSETYAYDSSGRLASRTVQLQLVDGGTARSLTRHSYDALGQERALSLPDGSTLEYRRNGQNQVVALARRLVRTTWLAWLMPAAILVTDIERDIKGIRRFTYGNGIEANYRRSREGALARVVYRQSRPLVDRRYWWDAAGNLLKSQELAAPQGSADYAYDAQDRLIAAAVLRAGAPANYARYFYDGAGNRLLSQEDLRDQADLRSGTIRAAYAEKSNRRIDAPAAKSARGVVRFDAGGQSQLIGSREYRWDALGRLSEVREARAAHEKDSRRVASYRYNHRGERIAKATGRGRTHFLYEAGRLIAELDAQGRITRQYVYLGEQPVALIDTPGGRDLADERTPLGEIAADLVTVIRAWLFSDEAVVFLHSNHLGAPELATDAAANPLWRAAYAPFGRVARTGAAERSDHFRLNLRLPGQYEDEETGLHYNGRRYYDPERGQYLTPDPLGLVAGLNGYRYAADNPLKYVDPEGLILFAFDGTNNSNPPPGVDDFSNVYKFYLAYDAAQNGPKWYMNGVGRDDPESRIQTNWLDDMNANTARARVDYMLQQLDQYVRTGGVGKGGPVDIDIVGFSRGAAMARDFSNAVATRLDSQPYRDSGACIQIRFLGLWDTVAQFGLNGADNGSWQLAIPAAAKHVFQAVALNEHRYLFPGESIGAGTQKGFIGSHADIGGSYGTGDLSDAALNWIVDQAKKSGVKMKAWKEVGHEEWAVVTDPVLHDKSNGSGDRDFCLRANHEAWASNCQKQRQASPGGMNWSQTASYVNFYAEATMDADGSSRIVGEVNMEEYGAWLKQNYGFELLSAAP